MPSTDEVFAIPVSSQVENLQEETRGSGKLTNADFRRLMMTPRITPGSGAVKDSTESSSGKPEEKKSQSVRRDPKEEARANERKRKKSYYAKIRKEDEQKMAELAEKYRDRALERRDGVNPDYQQDDSSADGQGAYRAVAPDLKSGIDAAERRKQMIQESKFLGGDMEHTHLVKGLDYALLQKVRSEITFKETAEAEAATKGEGDKSSTQQDSSQDQNTEEHPSKDEQKMHFKTSTGRRIFNTIQSSRSPPEFNDLFLPGRMAYSIDLEADDEIPTTMIRSKADLQGIESMQATFTSNDLVIQKLSQILSYLRTGRTSKKLKKKDVKKVEGGKTVDESIYGDIGSYTPAFVTNTSKAKDSSSNSSNNRDARGRDKDFDRRDNRDSRRERERDRADDRSRPRGSYFSKSGEEEANALRSNRRHRDGTDDRGGGWGSKSGAQERVGGGSQSSTRNIPSNSYNSSEGNATQNKQKTTEGEKKRKFEDNFYTECYPDMAEMHDAIDDSDDEADYTKMDLGNKKGPIGRWDFDTQEEYSDYMNQKEALPKAAFQYGVKMADGRKTRRIPGTQKDRNAEASREWQQIQAILKKRKEGGDGGDAKRGRYEY